MHCHSCKHDGCVLLHQHTHLSGNSVEFNQSDDDFKTPEVFLILCAICIRCSVGVTSEVETTLLKIKVLHDAIEDPFCRTFNI